LSSHYPRRQLGSAEFGRWLADYADDLGSYPLADVRLACQLWRRSDNKQMPSPGQLLTSVKRLGHQSDLARVGAAFPRLPAPEPDRGPDIPNGKEAVARMLAEVRQAIKPKSLREMARRPGETEVQQAERLWPNRRIDRVKGNPV